MKKKIAILFQGNSTDIKGAFLSTVNSIKKLVETNEFEINPFLIQSYDGIILRYFRKSIAKKENEIIINGVTLSVIWIKFSIIDYLLEYKLHCNPIFFNIRKRKIAEKLSGYDLIKAHSLYAGEIALFTHQKYDIPYCMSWHGSDIHSTPFFSKSFFRRTKIVMQHAASNFFISKNLLQKSNEIFDGGDKHYLYNYVDLSTFYPQSEEKILETKNKFNLPKNKPLVAFMGNLVEVKNAFLLPHIFFEIKKRMENDIGFFVVGDGKLKNLIVENTKKLNLDVFFFGKSTTI